MCQMQQATVAELWNGQGWNLHLRRYLNDWEMCRTAEFHVTLAQFNSLSWEDDLLYGKWRAKDASLLTQLIKPQQS